MDVHAGHLKQPALPEKGVGFKFDQSSNQFSLTDGS